jgi:hypothetical protein
MTISLFFTHARLEFFNLVWFTRSVFSVGGERFSLGFCCRCLVLRRRSFVLVLAVMGPNGVRMED